MEKVSFFWFRRDLRLEDNRGLYEALRSGYPVVPVFIFDVHILDKLADRQDARVTFIHRELERIQELLQSVGSALRVRVGDPLTEWQQLVQEYSVHAVYCNTDYEPYAVNRDRAISDFLAAQGIAFHAFKDQVVFHELEVCKKDGRPYTVFTPYSKAWKVRLQEEKAAGNDPLAEYPTQELWGHFSRLPVAALPSLESIGFQASALPIPDKQVSVRIIREYAQHRDFPAIEGTSRLGIHFRFGTISIREKARKSMVLSETFLNELIWRDFYAMILFNFPKVVGQSFRPEYDAIAWLNREEDFVRWQEGMTGYPIVDAGMRQLRATGYMHNRVRMIVASFLTKHLLIDWRWGEAWFAEKLLDFDLASNNGGWQWAAGCGTDAAPYFRVFNPTSQQEKFDPEWKYIRQWVPELNTPAYPRPMVDHAEARARCLSVYKAGIESGRTSLPPLES